VTGHHKERKAERTPDPILKARQARLQAVRVMEKEAHYTDDKVYAPKVSIWWEILDDKAGADHKGVRFWDNYSFVKSFDDDKKYVIREGTRIGDLAAFMAYEFHDGADYFESDVEVDFEALEGEEVIASLEPRRFKEEAPTGTRTVSETLMLAEKADKVAVEHKQLDKPDNAGAAWVSDEISVRAKAQAEEDEDFDALPF
jgi:hypothetical protein